MNEYYDKDEDTYKAKIVLVGETGVGKTNIVRKFGGGTFVEKYKPTLMSKYITKNVTIRKKEIELNFWDTPGNKKYGDVTKIFLKNAHVVLLVYDITNKKSFYALKDYWIEYLKKCYQLNPKCK